MRLSAADRPHLDALLAADQVANCFFIARVEQLGVDRSSVWGAWDGGVLRAAVMVSGNVVPAGGDLAGLQALGALLGGRPRTATSIVGLDTSVAAVWRGVAGRWGAARDERWSQPLLIADPEQPAVAPDPLVRAADPKDVDLLYPASVRMFTEEVGVSPLVGSSEAAYRARLAALVSAGRVFRRIDAGQVVFKAEIAAATAAACQVQGVWVAPELRGRGHGARGMAAVAQLASQRVSPTVSLYVNDYNAPALAAYARAGFVPAGRMASVLF